MQESGREDEPRQLPVRHDSSVLPMVRDEDRALGIGPRVRAVVWACWASITLYLLWLSATSNPGYLISALPSAFMLLMSSRLLGGRGELARMKQNAALLAHSRFQSRLLGQGDTDGAVKNQERFMRVELLEHQLPLALHDLGYYEMRNGEPHRALVLFSKAYELYQRDGLGGVPLGGALSFDELLASNMSMALCLEGKLDDAQRWIDSVEADHIPLARAIHLARQRRFDELVENMAEAEEHPSFEHEEHSLRVFFLMMAYASFEAKTPGERFAEWLELARPSWAGEFDYLSVDWPGLATFVEDYLAVSDRGGRKALPAARLIES